MTNCKNCQQPITDMYCSNCGEPAVLKRIDSHYLTHEVQHLLHFEKGFFYTVRELFIRPGQGIQTYINDNRKKFIKPIPFLIFTSLIYTIINNLFHVEERMFKLNEAELSKHPDAQSAVTHMLQWIQGHYGYANIMMGGVIALLLLLFFRKYKYNIFEITILLCFVMGEGMLLMAVFSILFGITKIKALYTIMGVLSFLYSSWAIAQFYDKSKFSSYIKAFFAYLIGAILFYVVVIVLGVMIDVVGKS